MKKILVVGPAWVGDMVMAQSLFKALKANQKEVVIDVLAPEWTRPLLDRMPEVTTSHALPIGHGALQLTKRYQIAKTLRSHRYDEAIVLPNSWKSALIPWWAKIPKRTGWLGECRWGLLNDRRILNKQHFPRMVERYVALAYEKNIPSSRIISSVPFPALTTSPVLPQTLAKFSITLTSSQPIIALCPGAEFGASKRWPEQHYATLAKEQLKAGWAVWLFGSKKDMPVAEHIQKSTDGQCINFTGQTTLGEAIDLLSCANSVITNDSGLMHIASALQKPVIALYGSTDPTFTPPLGSNSKIMRLSLPCSPCFKRECPLEHHRCMRDLQPQQVLALIGESR